MSNSKTVSSKNVFDLNDLMIKSANWRDVNKLLKLEKLCFSPNDAWPLLDIIAVLSSSGTVRLKIEFNDQMIAFAAAEKQIHNINETDSQKIIGWITTIAVAPNFRHLGIGTKLLLACESALGIAIIRLSVRSSNQNAIQLYTKNGYKQVDIWKNYYVGNEDALVLEKNLTSVLSGSII